MGTEVRDFLAVVKQPTESMSLEELAGEVDGWRVVMDMLPREVFEWLARMHDIVRFTKRNYQNHTGVLMAVKFEATEFTIGLQEAGWDSLRGQRTIEDKVLQIPQTAIMYVEYIGDIREYDPQAAEDELAHTSIFNGGEPDG